MTTPPGPTPPLPPPPARPMAPPVREQAPEAVRVPQPPDREATVPAATDVGTPASTVGRVVEGLLAPLGSGLLFTAADIASGTVDLSQRPQPLPGVRLKQATLKRKRQTIVGDLDIPAVANGEIRFTLDEQGKASISGSAGRQLDIPALGNPTVTVALGEAGQLSGEVRNIQIAPAALRGLKADVSADLRLAAGRITGSGTATVAYPRLGSATMTFGMSEEGVFTGSGHIDIDPPFLPPVKADLAVDESRNLTGSATVDLSGQASPLPGLTLSGGTLVLGYHNGQPSAVVTALTASYAGLASLQIERMAADKATGFTGSGSFVLAVPMIEPVAGQVNVRPTGVSGSLTISAKDFPKGLPVKNGQIVVKLSEDGKVGFSGTVGVDLGPAGTGKLDASYDAAGRFTIGADIDLTVPGLMPVHVSVTYADGQLGARAEAPLNSERLPGLSGNAQVVYQDGLWSGETTLNYSADSGKVSGSITVRIAQTEKGDLQLGGEGTVTAQLMPKISGTLTAKILPDGGIDVSGTITVSEPVELFPELRTEKELLSISKNIPLWAILVAVIRLKAGIRAGIGPGVFRNITVTGSYTLGATEADPSFSVSGELFIPAFVEGYVSFGAGLGLDVVLGELTGGIEGVATAGLYGAISVVPELFYENGDWGIEGTATLAAGARLKLALNAWAEIEAFWVTVWDKTWKLAEVVMPIGPDLALQAHMAYRFNRPEPPTLDFTTSDIDAESLIQSAMPEDAPPPSGARQALENKAEWKGALRERKAAPIPSELAAASEKKTAAPEPPAKPPKKQPPKEMPAGEKQALGTEPESQDPTKHPTPGNEPARSRAVDQAAKPDATIPPPVPSTEVPKTDTPRYQGPITLATLDEPPVPIPRTRAQEEQDLDAAQEALRAASAQASDSDTLDNYFLRVKKRFGLASLGYQGDFQTGFEIAGEINPGFTLQPKERLTGTGIPGDLTGRLTKVEFTPSSLGSKKGIFPVGVKMVAKPLGPDHPLGTDPKGQDDLMGLLPPGEYIRGHLLNQQLGGPGEVNNLFPITRSANATHEAQMEKWIKKWVNEDRYWVSYSVEVVGQDRIETEAQGISFIDASLKLKASILGTDLKPQQTVETTITSKYGAKSTSEKPLSREDIEQLEGNLPRDLARKIDKKVEVQVSRDDSPVEFPADIEQALAKKIQGKGQKAAIEQAKERLQGYPGVGPERARVLFEAYEEIHGGADRTVQNLSAVDRGQLRVMIQLWREGAGKLL